MFPLRGLPSALSAIVALCGNPLLLVADAPQRPNIIVIYTDDQGYGDASCLNPDAKFQTPNIDRIAHEGITFTDGHCSDTVCTPSRYGLLTGRYCWRTRQKTGVLGAEAECLIGEERVTLASLLRDAGYHTAMVGKWHLGMDFPGQPGARQWSEPVQDMPLDKGFDYFFGVPASLNYGVLAWFEGRHAQVPPTLYTAKKPNDRHSDYRIMPPYQSTPQATKQLLGTIGMEVAADFEDSQCLTRFTDKAIAWMQAKRQEAAQGKPFFLYLPYTSPHYPVCPLPQFHGQGQAGGYGEFVIETDFHVGRLLRFLDDSGLAENTLVVFTSDNGPESSWRARVTEFGHHSNGVFREGKRSIYEGGHRVPFLVRWPAGIVQPGRAYEHPICQTDLMATFAEMLGRDLPANAGEDSHSFYSVLLDSSANDSSPRAATHAIVHHAANGRFAIRDGNWKLVMPHGKLDFELYDVRADPSESNNVVEQHAELVQSLTERLSQIVVEGRTSRGPRQPNDTGYWKDLAWLTAAEFDAATR